MVNIEWESLFKKIDEAIAKGQRVRLSGGDPCMFPKESLKIAKYIMEKHGEKISIAHNGSSLSMIESLSGYLDYVALDFKAFSKDTLSKITGVVNPPQMQDQILSLCEKNGILVDVRTPIFGDTNYNDLLRIGRVLSKYPNVFWTLRKYNPVTNCNFKEISDSRFEEVVKSLISEFPNVRIGSRSYWNRGFSEV